MSIVQPSDKIVLSGDYLFFWCPGCNNAHMLNNTWTFDGNVKQPTISPSVLSTYPPTSSICHLFIRKGMVEFLPDSTHKLSGQTVELPEWPYTEEID